MSISLQFTSLRVGSLTNNCQSKFWFVDIFLDKQVDIVKEKCFFLLLNFSTKHCFKFFIPFQMLVAFKRRQKLLCAAHPLSENVFGLKIRGIQQKL